MKEELDAEWTCVCGHENESRLLADVIKNGSAFLGKCKGCQKSYKVSLILEALPRESSKGWIGIYKAIVRESLEYDLSERKTDDPLLREIEEEGEKIPEFPTRWTCVCGHENEQRIKMDSLYDEDFFGGTCKGCGEKKWIYTTFDVSEDKEYLAVCRLLKELQEE